MTELSSFCKPDESSLTYLRFNTVLAVPSVVHWYCNPKAVHQLGTRMHAVVAWLSVSALSLSTKLLYVGPA